MGPAENGQFYPGRSPHRDGGATDWADVSALCQRFGIPIPGDFVQFQ